MQHFPLTVSYIFRHGRTIHADSAIITWTDEGPVSATYAEVADRADRLAAALTRLGVGVGDRVGTFCWNNQHHLEAYMAVPSMGAVLHTLNIRLFPEQLAYVVNHAADRVIIVDGSLAPLLARVRDELRTVEHIITAGAGDFAGLGETLDLDELLAAEDGGFEYPEVDEWSAAAMCYTSGTTGNPKGVAYSHRSTYLHSFGVNATRALGLTMDDRLLVIVPMFHANAWGMPYAGWLTGADMVMPQQYLQAAPLAKIIEATRPTYSGAVPTVLNDLLHNRPDADLSSIREIVCGGSAVPASLMRAYDDVFGVTVVQGWGMTETSPLAAVARIPSGVDPADAMSWRARTGRVLAGVEVRICDDGGNELPWDGEAQGEIEIRGPWITGSYYLDNDDEKFRDGWLRTGDVGSVEPNGFIQISDRAKDVIKSGGEWISSVDLENELMGHPDIVEAAVVGVPDDRWDERPLACVVLAQGAAPDPAGLRAFLEPKVAKWWLPDRWSFIAEVPKTSVGKFDKKVLRRQFADAELEVVET
ncbi:MAG: long-chain fatty acid--CoA ligase [Acidimicrobiia bacterium]|nr:long-chain fatty acid--CoA ligase [Acidimicrobiia bacterium]